MQTFWSSTRATKNLASKFPPTQKYLEMDQIQIKYAIGSNCGKISKKGLVFFTEVSSSKAICKLLWNLTNKLVIAQNILVFLLADFGHFSYCLNSWNHYSVRIYAQKSHKSPRCVAALWAIHTHIETQWIAFLKVIMASGTEVLLGMH